MSERLTFYLLVFIAAQFLPSCNRSNSEPTYLMEGEGQFIRFEVVRTDLEIQERYSNEQINSEINGDTLTLTFKFQNEHEGYFVGYIDESTEPIDIGVLIKKQPVKNRTKFSPGIYHVTFTFLNTTNKEYNRWLTMDACDLFDLCEE